MEHHDTIRRMTNRDTAFYAIMGPFLSRREIVSELGFPAWDDDGKVWYAMMSGQIVMGFAAVYPKGEGAVFASAYVLPAYRGRGIYSILLDARLADTSARPITTTATDASRKALEARGFVTKGQRGRYKVMKKDKSDDV